MGQERGEGFPEVGVESQPGGCPMRGRGQEVRCLRVKGHLPLRDTQSPRSAVTRPAPSHAHLRERTLILVAPHQAPRSCRLCPRSPRVRRRWDLGLWRTSRQRSQHLPGRQATGIERRRHWGITAPAEAASVPSQDSVPRCLPQGQAQTHSRLVKEGAQSCTVPISNKAVPHLGTLPQWRCCPLPRPGGAAPPPRSTTRTLDSC